MKNASLNRYISFDINERSFALSTLVVREITRPFAITSLPGAGRHLRGIINLRGKILAVIDPAETLVLEPLKEGVETRFIVLKAESDLGTLPNVRGFGAGGEPVAIVVTRVHETIELEDDDIHEAPTTHETKAKGLVFGLANTPGGVVSLIDAGELLETVAIGREVSA